MSVLPALAVDFAYTWARLFAALAASILFSIVIGVAAARNKRAERILLPVLDIGQTIPIVGFFPVVIALIVAVVPGYGGINLAVIFLLFTSMVWNIAFGVYESIKAIPQDLMDVAELQRFDTWRRLWSLYLPASMPRLAYQSVISWSIGLFYLVTSEIFSTGSKAFAVKHGLGVVIAQLSITPNLSEYVTVIIIFVAAVLLTRFLVLTPLSEYAERFSFKEETKAARSRALRFYTAVHRAISGVVPSFELPRIRIVKRAAVQRKPFTRPRPQQKGISVLLLFCTAVFFVLLGIYVVETGTAGYIPTVLIALAASFVRVWGIYIICAAISLPLGILIGKSERVYGPIMSVLQVISAVPAPILLPIVVALVFSLPFGGEITALVIIFIAEIWYILFSVVAGIRTVPNSLIELKQAERLKWYQAWKDVYIPAALPSFVTGSITAIGGAWNSLIVAEYFSPQTSSSVVVSVGTSATSATNATIVTQVGTGIGKVLDLGVFQGNIPHVVLALVALTTLVVVMNRLVWQRIYNRVTERYKMAL